MFKLSFVFLSKIIYADFFNTWGWTIFLFTGFSPITPKTVHLVYRKVKHYFVCTGTASLIPLANATHRGYDKK